MKKIFNQSIFKKVYSILTPEERIKTLIIFMLSFFNALAHFLSVFSLFPFINIIIDPNSITENNITLFLYNLFNFSSINNFLIFFGVLVFIILVSANLLGALTTWMYTRFANNRNNVLSSRLLKSYLNKNYDFFLNRNSSELSKNILAEVNVLSTVYISNLFTLITNILITLLIIIAVMIIDPVVSSISIVTIGGVYLIIDIYFRKKRHTMANLRQESNKIRYRSANEALLSIKTTKVLGVEDFFINRYMQSATRFARANTFVAVLSLLPKYLIEAVAFGGLVFFLVFLIILGNDIAHIIPIVSVFALAGYRLLPAIQIIFQSYTNMQYSKPIIDNLSDDFFQSLNQIKSVNKTHIMPFDKAVSFQKVIFKYTDENKYIFGPLDLKISKGEMIGFAGTTGSGKTTLVDIFMGLLLPKDGAIVIDDTKLTIDNIKSWQKNIGYVPQDIYLSDDTITNNIAFGIKKQNIDLNKVKEAARLAALDLFIENELPEQYNTVVGDRGIRLSGGQKQRIGLARALYFNPTVLILDEATSSLDGKTEDAVLSAIEQVAKERTVIMIAHRLTSLKKCDRIYILENGKVINSGNYQELLEKDLSFRQMANIS
jgi:ATP-binding cassette, subfamily B, bacterial PglK